MRGVDHRGTDRDGDQHLGGPGGVCAGAEVWTEEAAT